MRTCLLVLSLILVLEGVVAWISGLSQLAAMLAGTVCVGGMASFWKRRGGEWGWLPLVLLFVVAAVAVMGLRNCGLLVAVSSLHFVAWYYTARAVRFGAPDLVPGTLDGRPGIYAVAFYGTLILAVVLVRGGMLPIAKSIGVPLAFVLFLLGLVVLEKGRFLRMREGTADRASRKRGVVARGLALIAVAAGLFFVFAKPVPVVADQFVKMVLDLQGKGEDSGLDADDMPEMEEVPTGDRPGEVPEPQMADGNGDEQRQEAGDSMSQSRRLPARADLQSSHDPRVYLELESEAQAAAIARRPVYVRSSTLGSYVDGEWRRVGENRDPRWLLDRNDGREDGKVTLPSEFAGGRRVAEVRCEVYVRESSGAALLALQGVSEFDLPQVQVYDNDWYRAALVGNVRYGAASRPLSLEDLLDDDDLRPGNPQERGVFVEVEDSALTERMETLLADLPVGSLGERLLWIKQYLATNYEYSRKIENPDLLDPLENFLFEEKRGYCDFFATSGALFARMIGVPSRIAYGYTKGEFDGVNWFTFYADGAHSWPEIYLEGYGWVVFDVTPSSGNGDGGGQGLVERGERPDLSDFAGEEPKDGLSGVDDSRTVELDSDNSAVSDLVSYLLFCGSLLAFAVWYFLKRDPAREAEQAGEGSAGKKVNRPAYLVEFCRVLKMFDVEPQNGETLVEMLKSLRRQGVPVDGFDAMKRYHYGTRYEEQPVDPKQEKRFLQDVRAYIKEHSRPRS